MSDSRADLERVREFFRPRADTWDDRFPDDGPAFAAAVAALQLPVSGAALDVGCGTGRALASLRDAVGASGTVVALDATPEMLTVAQRVARVRFAALVLADANRAARRNVTPSDQDAFRHVTRKRLSEKGMVDMEHRPS